MTTTTDYEKQATDFLKEHHLKLTATPAGMQCPPWSKCDNDKPHSHGRRYRIEIERMGAPEPLLRFDFWDSIDSLKKKKNPTSYDVLACISSDSDCDETFEDWCDEFGYDTDSRKAFAQWELCLTFAKKMRAFFTESDLSDLREIE